jgi:hypothetical protein
MTGARPHLHCSASSPLCPSFCSIRQRRRCRRFSYSAFTCDTYRRFGLTVLTYLEFEGSSFSPEVKMVNVSKVRFVALMSMFLATGMSLAQTQPEAVAPPPPAPLPVPVQVPPLPTQKLVLFPVSYFLIGCDADGGKPPCPPPSQGPQKWNEASVDKENGWRICTFTWHKEGHIRGDCDEPWIDHDRKVINGGACSAQSDPNTGEGGYAYAWLDTVKLVAQPLADEPGTVCSPTSSQPPPSNSPPGCYVAPVRCDGGVPRCEQFCNGRPTGTRVSCPTGMDDLTLCRNSKVSSPSLKDIKK